MTNTNNRNPKYGWNPDTSDQRDRIFRLGVQPDLSLLPKQVDLRPWCSPVENQYAVGSCHDDQTDVLTDAGWKKFELVGMQDKLATVNPNTSELFYEYPTRIISREYVGKMYKVDNMFLDFCVTPDHEMLVRKWNEPLRRLSDEYVFVKMEDVGWNFGLLNKISWNGNTNEDDFFIIDGVEHKLKKYRSEVRVPMGSWLKFLGIYIAEGTMLKINQRKNRSTYCIQIAASKEREKIAIRSIFSELGIHALELRDRFKFDDKRIYYAMMKLGLMGIKAPQKRVPEFIFNLSASKIRDFLFGHFSGDGCESIEGNRAHYTSSVGLADDIQRLIFLSGSSSFIGIRPPRKSITSKGRSIIGRYNEHRVSVCEKRTSAISRNRHIFTEDYSGKVYCAEVPSFHTLVTRRNGKILISGNCTANASVGALEYLEIKSGNTASYEDLSRLFVYYNTRQFEGTLGQDCGATIRNTIKILVASGSCAESMWPYVTEKYNDQPLTECYESAKQHIVTAYERINTFESMVHCLADGYPFVFGFSVFSEFEGITVAQTGVLNLPTPSETFKGGHAVLAVGYDMDAKTFLVKNSWGSGWGQNGYFTIPFAYITNPNLAQDMWCVRALIGHKS